MLVNLSTRIVNHLGCFPLIESQVFIAPNASVIGNVYIGKGSSIWHNVTVRGDGNCISIGQHTNIQEHVVIHGTKMYHDTPISIGNYVTIGPSAIVHACTIHDHCIVGTGATVLDGAVMEPRSIVTAGSVVTYNKIVRSGQVWSGIPARYVRDLTPQEHALISQFSMEYATLAQVYRQEYDRPFNQVKKREKLRVNSMLTIDQGLFLRY